MIGYLFYRLLTWLAAPLLPLYLARRADKGKEDRTRLPERFGHASLPRPAGTLVWVHAASVGEMNSALSLIAALAERLPQAHFLVTTITVTSARLIGKKLPPRTLHQFAPVDTPMAVKRFLAHWRPRAALFIESELWPNMLMESKRADVRLFIINGRMSDKSFRLWSRFAGFSRLLLGCFDAVYAQSRHDGGKYAGLGADAQYLGNLKYDAPPPGCDETALTDLRTLIGDRPLWLAASTHPGEEEQIVQVHRILATFLPDLLTIIVPRHAARGGDVTALIAAQGYEAKQRSRQENIAPSTAFYIADTMGELGLFYRLAAVVFVGGSLVPHGGQNLIEPAMLGCVVACGPHMWNFAEVVAEFKERQALVEVADPERLAGVVRHALTEPAYRVALSQAAQAAANRYHGITARLADALVTALR